MDWVDIASIVFICVTVNHLGLVSAVEEVLGCKLPIVGCVKCSAFWAVLIYSMLHASIVKAVAVSFLASYAAIWMELIEGVVDYLYLKLYGKITSENTSDTLAATADGGDTASSVSDVQ